ncbi:hypothetical protein MASR2M74_07150 [Paracoccaceae bacterium]
MVERRRLNPCPLAAPVAATPLPSGKALLHPALAAAPSPITRVAGESHAEAALQEVSATMARA